jgi:photosystem II stability/assembly factor-like uncharacterized protein
MKLYLGTDSGLFVFEGSEEEWHPRYVRLQERRVTALTVAGEELWVGTTAGLWHSADGGATCIAVHAGETPPHVRALARHPREPGLILVGTEPAAILVSRDGGGTWEEAPDVARLRDAHGWSLPYSPAAGCIRGFAVLRSRIYAAAEVAVAARGRPRGRAPRQRPL